MRRCVRNVCLLKVFTRDKKTVSLKEDESIEIPDKIRLSTRISSDGHTRNGHRVCLICEYFLFINNRNWCNSDSLSREEDTNLDTNLDTRQAWTRESRENRCFSERLSRQVSSRINQRHSMKSVLNIKITMYNMSVNEKPLLQKNQTNQMHSNDFYYISKLQFSNHLKYTTNEKK